MTFPMPHIFGFNSGRATGSGSKHLGRWLSLFSRFHGHPVVGRTVMIFRMSCWEFSVLSGKGWRQTRSLEVVEAESGEGKQK